MVDKTNHSERKLLTLIFNDEVRIPVSRSNSPTKFAIRNPDHLNGSGTEAHNENQIAFSFSTSSNPKEEEKSAASKARMFIGTPRMNRILSSPATTAREKLAKPEAFGYKEIEFDGEGFVVLEGREDLPKIHVTLFPLTYSIEEIKNNLMPLISSSNHPEAPQLVETFEALTEIINDADHSKPLFELKDYYSKKLDKTDNENRASHSVAGFAGKLMRLASEIL